MHQVDVWCLNGDACYVCMLVCVVVPCVMYFCCVQGHDTHILTNVCAYLEPIEVVVSTCCISISSEQVYPYMCVCACSFGYLCTSCGGVFNCVPFSLSCWSEHKQAHVGLFRLRRHTHTHYVFTSSMSPVTCVLYSQSCNP